jgi:hypothetical protein
MYYLFMPTFTASAHITHAPRRSLHARIWHQRRQHNRRKWSWYDVAWRHLLAWRRGGIGISKHGIALEENRRKAKECGGSSAASSAASAAKENLGIGVKRGGGENDRYEEILKHRN